MMRFYNQQHRFYCGVDLHARTLSLCILDADGATAFHGTLAASPHAFLDAIEPYRQQIVVCSECLFAWYWLADLCQEKEIPFVLGHALYMKAIHGGKAKTDKIDAKKIAVLLRGAMLPQAYVYPKGMRETRDLLRRRTYLVRRPAECLPHLVNTNSQYNHPPLAKKLCYAVNRD
jgi:transposase